MQQMTHEYSALCVKERAMWTLARDNGGRVGVNVSTSGLNIAIKELLLLKTQKLISFIRPQVCLIFVSVSGRKSSSQTSERKFKSKTSSTEPTISTCILVQDYLVNLLADKNKVR